MMNNRKPLFAPRLNSLEKNRSYTMHTKIEPMTSIGSKGSLTGYDKRTNTNSTSSFLSVTSGSPLLEKPSLISHPVSQEGIDRRSGGGALKHLKPTTKRSTNKSPDRDFDEKFLLQTDSLTSIHSLLSTKEYGETSFRVNMTQTNPGQYLITVYLLHVELIGDKEVMYSRT